MYIPDVDECINKIHDCDVNAACLNTDGSFGCMCNAGYTGNATVDNCEGMIKLLHFKSIYRSWYFSQM